MNEYQLMVQVQAGLDINIAGVDRSDAERHRELAVMVRNSAWRVGEGLK